MSEKVEDAEMVGARAEAEVEAAVVEAVVETSPRGWLRT